MRVHTEMVLLVDERPQVREAVTRPYVAAGAYVVRVPGAPEAIRFLAMFRPEWILVGEKHAHELLLWLGSHGERVEIPVLLLPDLKPPSPGDKATLRAA